MATASKDDVQHEEHAPETRPPAPDSGRRPRPREQLATLPGETDFEHHDTIPAPPWLDEPLTESQPTL